MAHPTNPYLDPNEDPKTRVIFNLIAGATVVLMTFVLVLILTA